jgi:glycosyltransferase involved in cell wall biosynthesis
MIVICIPLARRHRTTIQQTQVAAMCHSLSKCLAQIKTTKSSYVIQVIINGPPIKDLNTEVLAEGFLALKGKLPVRNVNIVSLPQAGKIHAVNYSITECTGQGIIVIDDDIILPTPVFIEIDSFLRLRRSLVEALGYPKAPLFWPNPTPFQSQLNFLFHPSVQHLLIKSGFFKRLRPSGSFYVLHGNHMAFFPNPCNEADILYTRHITLSRHFVRTLYPPTFQEEIKRRVKHFIDRINSATAIDLKPVESISSYNAEIEMLGSDLPKGIYYRLQDTLGTMKSIMLTVQQEVSLAKHRQSIT